MTKLKVILVILLASFVIFMPKASLSQDNQRQLELLKMQLQPLLNQLVNYNRNLYDIMGDATKLGPALTRKDLNSCHIIRQDIMAAKQGLWYICELFSTLPMIRNDAILPFMNRQIEIITTEKRLTYDCLDTVQRVSGFVENKAALHQFDKAKDNIRAILGLYDELIEMLQQYIEKVEGKQKRKE